LKTRLTISTGVISRTLTTTALVLAAACSSDPASPVASSTPALSQAPSAAGPEIVAGEVIVKFRAGASANGRGAALRAANAQVSERILTDAMRGAGDGEGLTVVHTPMNVPAAIQALRGSPDVEYAEPNYVYHHQATSDDTYFLNGSLWGMYGGGTSPANPFGSNAAAAWAAGHTGAGLTGANTVYVGVIDEGIQFSHRDLDANIWTNPFDPADGVDNDGNGYVDDVRGWDFANNDNGIYDGGNRGSQDDHGTHVAGTIGAERNGAGVVGVSWHVKMISGKFLGRNGGTTANAVRAVDYFTDLKKRHGMRIVATSNSWGGGGSSTALRAAIARADTAGILFIAAAGNSTYDCDVTACFPANYDLPNVIAVASITSSGALSSFSNYGATKIHIGAPGSGISSTTAFNTYSTYSGTSMATPHVSGAAALYASVHASATAAQIKNALLSSAVRTDALVGKTTTGGRLDVNAALSK
jgi:hypothetical protein